MKKVSYAVKLSEETSRLVRDYCATKGLKQGYFVELALKEKIEKDEDLEDAQDFIKYAHQEKDAVLFEEYLKTRKK